MQQASEYLSPRISGRGYFGKGLGARDGEVRGMDSPLRFFRQSAGENVKIGRRIPTGRVLANV